MTSCPACGLRCVVRFDSDSAECRDHGLMAGLLLLRLNGVTGWQALIEIRAYQLHWQVRREFSRLNKWLYNDSDLKIRVPSLV